MVLLLGCILQFLQSDAFNDDALPSKIQPRYIFYCNASGFACMEKYLNSHCIDYLIHGEDNIIILYQRPEKMAYLLIFLSDDVNPDRVDKVWISGLAYTNVSLESVYLILPWISLPEKQPKIWQSVMNSILQTTSSEYHTQMTMIL